MIINGHKDCTVRSKQTSNVRCRIATALPPLYFCVFSVRQAVGEVLFLKRHLAGVRYGEGSAPRHPHTWDGKSPSGRQSGPGVAPGPGVALQNASLLWGERGTGVPERKGSGQRGRRKIRRAKPRIQQRWFGKEGVVCHGSSCWEVKGNKTRSAPGLAIQGTSLTFLRTASWGREQMRGQREARKQIYSAESSLNTHHLEEATRKTSWSKGGSHARKGSVFTMA